MSHDEIASVLLALHNIAKTLGIIAVAIIVNAFMRALLNK